MIGFMDLGSGLLLNRKNRRALVPPRNPSGSACCWWHLALGCSDEVGYTITRQTRVESIRKHRKSFIYPGSNSRGSTNAALNHVSK